MHKSELSTAAMWTLYKLDLLLKQMCKGELLLELVKLAGVQLTTFALTYVFVK